MKRILVVIDYQNDFVDGSLGFSGAEKLDSGISEKIASYPKGCVFYTLDTHSSDYLETREGRMLPVTHCIDGTYGHAVYGKTAEALKAANAVGFRKRSFGLEITPEVASLLPESADEIELVGLVSNICVISNAVVFQTHYPQAEIIVDAALTAAPDDSLNQKALDVMEGLQIKVINR